MRKMIVLSLTVLTGVLIFFGSYFFYEFGVERAPYYIIPAEMLEKLGVANGQKLHSDAHVFFNRFPFLLKPSIRGYLIRSQGQQNDFRGVAILSLPSVVEEKWAAQMFRELALSADFNLRDNAVEMLGRIRDLNAVGLLGRLWKETDSDLMAYRIASSMMRISTKDFVPYLTPTANSYSSKGSFAYVVLFQLTGEASFKSSLEGILHSSPRKIRGSILVLMGASKDVRFEELLKKMVDDKDEKIGSIARKALTQLYSTDGERQNL